MKTNEAVKSAPTTTAPAKNRGGASDDEALLVPPPPPKATFLPTGLSRALVIGSVLFAVGALIVGLLGNRFVLVPVQNNPNAFVYRLDRLTGGIVFCTPGNCNPVQIKLDKNDKNPSQN